jgi:hypothetical protein
LKFSFFLFSSIIPIKRTGMESGYAFLKTLACCYSKLAWKVATVAESTGMFQYKKQYA